jgi:hypothetical protein
MSKDNISPTNVTPVTPDIIHQDGTTDVVNTSIEEVGKLDTDQYIFNEAIDDGKTAEVVTFLFPDTPIPPPPKSINANVKDEIPPKLNAWWTNSSFLAAMIAIAIEIGNTELKNQYQEGQLNVKLNGSVLNLSKSNAQLTKDLYEQQASEKKTEAFSAFATGGMAAVQAFQNYRNVGTASKKIDGVIQEKEGALTQAQATLTQSEATLQTKKVTLDATKGNLERQKISMGMIPDPKTGKVTYQGQDKYLGPDGQQRDLQTNPRKVEELEQHEQQQLTANEQAVEREKTDVQTSQKKVDTDQVAVNKAQQLVDVAKNSRATDIREEVRHMDLIQQLQGEAMKQSVQASSHLIIAGIKVEEGIIESNKQINEGFLQALNKYVETSSKSRDESRSNLTRGQEFISRVIDANFKSSPVGSHSA